MCRNPVPPFVRTPRADPELQKDVDVPVRAGRHVPIKDGCELLLAASASKLSGNTMNIEYEGSAAAGRGELHCGNAQLSQVLSSHT